VVRLWTWLGDSGQRQRWARSKLKSQTRPSLLKISCASAGRPPKRHANGTGDQRPLSDDEGLSARTCP
jgi:hypothetical protein